MRDLELDWHPVGQETLEAVSNGYLLIVEQLSMEMWFYSVRYSGEEVWASYLDERIPISCFDAQLRAERMAKDHFTKYIEVKD